MLFLVRPRQPVQDVHPRASGADGEEDGRDDGLPATQAGQRGHWQRRRRQRERRKSSPGTSLRWTPLVVCNALSVGQSLLWGWGHSCTRRKSEGALPGTSASTGENLCPVKKLWRVGFSAASLPGLRLSAVARQWGRGPVLEKPRPEGDSDLLGAGFS